MFIESCASLFNRGKQSDERLYVIVKDFATCVGERLVSNSLHFPCERGGFAVVREPCEKTASFLSHGDSEFSCVTRIHQKVGEIINEVV